MRVLVLVGQVPERLEFAQFDKAAGRVVFEPERVLNPHDAAALSEAARLVEKHRAEVVVVAADAQGHEDGVREALAYAGGEGIVLSGPQVASTDGVGLGYAFAEAARRIGMFDVALLAGASPDPEWGLVAGSFAEHLDFPLLVEARDLKPGPRWACEALHGRERWRVEVAAPFVATVSPLVARVHPTAWGITDAYGSRTVRTVPLHELDAEGTLMPRLAARAVVRRQALEKPAREGGELWSDEPEDAARMLLRRLRNQGLLPAEVVR